MRFISKIRPEYVFVLIALFFEWRFNKVTPPLQASDEFHHFYRALQVSEGQLLPLKQDRRLGSYVPASVREFVFTYQDLATNPKYTIDPWYVDDSFKTLYSTKDPLFIDHPNTALYSPLCYAPQAIAIYFLKDPDVSVAQLYYGGRYISFIVWLIGMFFVIRMIPFGKWLMTLLILLPMNLYLANSFSADTVTIIIALLFIAYVLKLSLQDKPVSILSVFWLLLLITGLAMAKIVYVGSVVLLFVIPPKQFKNITIYISSLAVLFISAFILSWYWSSLTLEYYTPYLDYHPVFRKGNISLSSCANYHIQKQLMLDHMWYFPNVVRRSMFEHPWTYLHGYVGAFGNMDVLLPRGVIYFSYLVIGITALTEKNERVTPLICKPTFIIAALICFILLIYSQHLTWDCIGEGIVDLVQGRYLIPLMPLLFLCFSHTHFKYTWVAPLVMGVSVIFIHRASCKVIYPRYFKESFYEEFEFSCDAEKVNDKYLYLTTNSRVNLEAGKYRSDSFAHSGKYSSYFDPWIQFNMTYRFQNLKYGDLVEISAWRKGKIGSIVLSGKGWGRDTNEFFYSNNKPMYYDERGWGYLHSIFTIKEDIDSAKAVLFLWCPDSTKRIYFDDLKFNVKHYKGRYLDSLYISP